MPQPRDFPNQCVERGVLGMAGLDRLERTAAAGGGNVRIETWIDRINRIVWYFILSILLIDVRQESKGRPG